MRPGRQGFALILVLLASAAVFALATHAAVLMRSASVESRVLVRRAEVEREARSAVALLLTGLSTTEDKFAQQMEAQGAEGRRSDPGGSSGGGGDQGEEFPLPEFFRQMMPQLAEELERNAADNSASVRRSTQGGGISGKFDPKQAVGALRVTEIPSEVLELRLRENGPLYRVKATDAGSMLNVNVAKREQLEAYLRAKALTPEEASRLTSEIIDWRDADDFREPFGAERDDHRRRGVVCRNAPFETIDELRYLPSMTRERFDLLRGDLGVTGDGRVHINTASSAVLLSVPGLDAPTVARIEEARRQRPLTVEDVARLLPAGARDAVPFLRVEPGRVLRIHVEVIDDVRAEFEGMAVVSDVSGVEAVGLRRVF
ncbi:MAG: type II secretion system protein GspK [Planctomycetota bacterium]|nr:type II secretion system protein GspK [Planctomycetota bacterium]